MTWRRTNRILIILIVLINAYVFLAPLTPRLVYWWQNRTGQRQQQLTARLHAPVSPAVTSKPAVNQPNSLVIPAMSLDQQIHEGPVSTTYKNLDQGIWRWPGGSTPDKGGNTIVLGHRFTYTQPKGVLYFLDKVKVGDEIGVWWNNVRYVYKVTSINTVPPSDTDILNQTSDSRLTIYTCTPLWHPVNRLVVVAEREGQS